MKNIFIFLGKESLRAVVILSLIAGGVVVYAQSAKPGAGDIAENKIVKSSHMRFLFERFNAAGNLTVPSTCSNGQVLTVNDGVAVCEDVASSVSGGDSLIGGGNVLAMAKETLRDGSTQCTSVFGTAIADSSGSCSCSVGQKVSITDVYTRDPADFEVRSTKTILCLGPSGGGGLLYPAPLTDTIPAAGQASYDVSDCDYVNTHFRENRSDGDSDIDIAMTFNPSTGQLYSISPSTDRGFIPYDNTYMSSVVLMDVTSTMQGHPNLPLQFSYDSGTLNINRLGYRGYFHSACMKSF